MIKNILQQKGMSIYQCSKLSGIPYTTLNEIVNGKTKIEKCNVMTIYALSKILNVSIENIIQGENFDYELFKSNLAHEIISKGEISYIVDILKSDEISALFNESRYIECFYKLAMLDYISKKNNIPVCNKYNEIRNNRLKEAIYSRDIMMKYKLTNSKNILEDSRKNAIPEFLRFNIIENEVLNTY